MSARKINVGDNYGSWTVVETPAGSRKVLLRCECGVELWRYASNLRNGTSTRCNACARKQAGIARTYDYSAEWQKDRLYQYFSSRVSGGQDFTLTKEECWTLGKSVCWYCGVEPTNSLGWQNFTLYYSGIDRIDSSLGYHTDNVRPACWDCNRAKNTLSDADFVTWVNRIYSHLSGSSNG